MDNTVDQTVANLQPPAAPVLRPRRPRVEYNGTWTRGGRLGKNDAGYWVRDGNMYRAKYRY